MTRRKRILVSAYGCVPGKGSEPGAGWAWAKAAAQSSDVWVLTEESCRPDIEKCLLQEPVDWLHVVYVRTPGRVAWKGDDARFNRGRYLAWQWYARRTAVRLHRQHRFDLVHHVTIGSDWMPVGVAGVRGVPLVWGPVGGFTVKHKSLVGSLGSAAAAKEIARDVMTGAFRRLFADPVARRAALVLTQNPDVAKRFRFARRIVVEPHIALERSSLPIRRINPARSRPVAVFAGRLLHWKGVAFALEALARPQARDWRFDVYGDGPDMPALRQRAAQLGVTDRVRFMGQRARVEILDALSTADALLFPSLHDSAGWIVAEAGAIGCPVVCLAVGGPDYLVRQLGGISVSPDGDVATDLAEALSRLPVVAPSTRFDAERLPSLQDSWYDEVLAATSAERDAAALAGPLELPPLPDNPRVSVIMATYNYEEYLRAAVDSVLAQAVPNIELVICDDCSTDGTPALLAEISARDPRVRTLRTPCNVGQAAAMSLAFEQTDAEVICLLDADDRFLPGKIASVVSAMREPDVGLVTHRLQVIDFRDRWRAIVPSRGRLANGWVAEDVVAAGGMLDGLPQTSALAMRREVAEQVFPIPAEAFFADVYVQMVAPLVTRIGTIDRPLAEYRVHTRNLTSGYFGDSVKLGRIITSRQVGRAAQERVLGRDVPIPPLTNSLFHAKLEAARATIAGDSDAARWRAALVRHPAFRRQMLPDRILWRAAGVLPRPLLSAALRHREDNTSRLRMLLQRRPGIEEYGS